MNIANIASQVGTIYDRTLHTSLTLPYSGFDKIAIAENELVTAGTINSAIDKLYQNYIQLYRYSNVASNVIPISSIAIVGALPSNPPIYTTSTETHYLTSYTTTPVYYTTPSTTTVTYTVTTYQTVSQDLTSYGVSTSTAYYENLFFYSGQLNFFNLKTGWIVDHGNTNDVYVKAVPGKNISTVTPAPYITDPFNQTKAWKFVEGKNNELPGLLQYRPEVVVAGNTYTLSVYAKAAERSLLWVSVGSDYGVFDLTNGNTTTIPTSPGSTQINTYSQYVGNGWYRCVVTDLIGSNFSYIGGVGFGTLVSKVGPVAYQGDGSSGLYIYGPQLIYGSQLYPYMESSNIQVGLIPTPSTSQSKSLSIPFTQSTTWVVPANVASVNVLVVGGGGGANHNKTDGPAIATGNGKAGAGGQVVETLNYPVTPGQTINIAVGQGGQGGIRPLGQKVYPVTNSAWSSFMNTYGVWVNPATDPLVGQQLSIKNNFFAPYAGTYTLKAQADNTLDWYIDGVKVISGNGFKGAAASKVVTLTQGNHIMQFNVKNLPNPPGYNSWQYNPSGWAGTIANNSGNIIWDTRTFNSVEYERGNTGDSSSFDSIVAAGGAGGSAGAKPNGTYSQILSAYVGGDGGDAKTGIGVGGGGASRTTGNGGAGAAGFVEVNYTLTTVTPPSIQPVAITIRNAIASVTEESILVPQLATQTTTVTTVLSTVKYLTTTQITPVTFTNYTPVTTLNWYTITQYLTSTSFLPLSTTGYSNLDGIKTITGGINTSVSPNKYVLFASPGTSIVALTGDVNLNNISIALSTNTTALFSNVNFININKLVLDPNTNYLYAVDLSANLIHQFNASGFLTNDNIFANKLIYVRSIGGYGDYDAAQLFNSPRSLAIYNSNLYILDAGNSCIKQYDTDLNWIITHRLFRDFNTNYPIDISVDGNGNIHVLTSNNKILSYDSNFVTTTVTDLMEELEDDEYFQNIITSSVDANIFYLITNKNVYKKFYSAIKDTIGNYLFYRFNVSSREIITGFTSLVNAVGSDTNVIFSTYKNAGKFGFYDDNINLRTVLITDNFDVYPLSSVDIDSNEYVQNWIFNKALAKLIVNHTRLRNLIYSRFLYEPDSNGNIVYHGTRYMTPTETLNATFDQDMINFVGCNEIFQNNIINRSLKAVFDAQVAIFNMLQLDVRYAPDLNIPVYIN